MDLARDELKKLLKEKGVKSLDDFNTFMREISKEVVETLLEGELTVNCPPLDWSRHNVKNRGGKGASRGRASQTSFAIIENFNIFSRACSNIQRERAFILSVSMENM